MAEQDDWPVATADLKVGNVLAAVAGDRVPPDTVERNGWQDLVAKPNTRAAKAAGETAAESV